MSKDDYRPARDLSTFAADLVTVILALALCIGGGLGAVWLVTEVAMALVRGAW